MKTPSGQPHILFNGIIHTMSAERPAASAIAFTSPQTAASLDGIVLAVGDDASILQEFGDGAGVKIDLGGRAVIPGLTDSHVHLEQYAFSLARVNCETATREECLRRVEARAKVTAKGDWILGHGWAQAEWPGGFGTAAELDKIAPDHPVYLTAKSLHAAWANSAAMAISGIDLEAADPPGGKIQRASNGEPTGILFELAMELVSSKIPRPDIEASTAAIGAAQAQLWKLGLTGVHDFDRQRCFSALQELQQAGALQLRVVKSIPVEALDEAVSVGLRSGFGNDLLRIGSIKAFSDGALGPKTAAMLQPFDDDPDNTGILLLDREEVFEIGRLATAHGLSLTVHAIGDRANHEVISAYTQIREFEREHGLPRRRHRIEHVQLIHPQDVPRLAQAGVIASMQPIHATSDMIAADKSWGERSANAYAWQTLKSEGIFMTFGSDAPVDSPNPFWGMHAAVTRRRHDGSPGTHGWYPEQRLSVYEAVAGFTVAPAYTAGQEGRIGQLVSGQLADLVVLPQDPFSVEPDRLWEIEPLATVVGGEWVFSAL